MAETYVLDSTVVVAWFIPEQENHAAALPILRSVLSGEVVAMAPRYMKYEFYNALTKAFRLRGKAIQELAGVLNDFPLLPVLYVDESPALLLRAAILSHRFRKAFYDMGYFALAEEHAVPVCTGDKASVAGLGPGFPARHVLMDDFRV